MNLVKKEINKISHFGKQQSQTNLNGNLLGDKEDLVGTYNVLQWLFQF